MRNLLTKESRLKSQQVQFSSLTSLGYKQETYKTLEIFTLDESNGFLLKIFRGTASHPILFIKYRTAENRNKALINSKENYDRHEACKLKTKENPIMSTSANCAAAIKAELKKVYPNTKFYVKSSNFSGGNSVHINWTDGPTLRAVKEITGKYQYGHFNGMEDLYEVSNVVDNLPQAKYVSEQREMSETLKEILMPDAEKFYNDSWTDSSCHSAGNLLYRVFANTDIPYGCKVIGLKENDFKAGCATPENLIFIDIEPVEQIKEAVNLEKAACSPGQIKVIEYSEKSIAVIGETKAIKDVLKSLGGKFNFRLTCGPGWIFPKTLLTQLQTALTSIYNV